MEVAGSLGQKLFSLIPGWSHENDGIHTTNIIHSTPPALSIAFHMDYLACRRAI